MKRLCVFLTVLMTSQFSFSQNDSLDFTIDTIVSKKDSYDIDKFYYNKDIVLCKTYYSWPKTLHFEFVRLGPDKYYCMEYNQDGDIINEGVVIRESKPYDKITMPVYDSVGNILRYADLTHKYKLQKDEFWYERTDSVLHFQYGKYTEGLKDSTWIEIHDRDIQNEFFYNKGRLVKNEKVNLTSGLGNEIKKTLVIKWILNTNLYSQPWKFIPADQSNIKNEYGYIQFNIDGTFLWSIDGGIRMKQNTVDVGKWSLVENNSKIKLVFKEGNNFAKIEYISKYGLTLLFE